MGCISSKLKADDVVGRCKARKGFMKQAVMHRHSFAAAHTAYLLSLRNTGAALLQFAEAEGALPATGHGLYALTPKPPPPPPLSPSRDSPSFLNQSTVYDDGGVGPEDVNDPLPQNKNLEDDDNSAAVDDDRVASPSQPKSWDFFEPFQPTDPPLHLQKHRKTLSMQGLSQETTIDQVSEETELDVGGKRSSLVVGDLSGDKEGQTLHKDSSVQQDAPNEGVSVEDKESQHVGSPMLCNKAEDIDGKVSLLMRLAVRKDLVDIARELSEEFLKASASGVEVSRALETGTGHFEADSQQSKFRSYRSARVFSALSWGWSRSPLSSKEELYTNVDHSGCNASHALTLERLLAWEKKLFDEVKVMDSLRVEHENKCHILRRLETRRGEDAKAIDKIRAEIKRLHSLILISYQGVDSTIEAIEDLRDDELHPQLMVLIERLNGMWDTMHQCHARQTQIIIHIKGLDAMRTQEPTSEAHHQATIQLETELMAWHQSFCKLVSSHRGYMDALYGWLKLSMIVIPTGKEKKVVDHEESGGQLEVFRLCEEWQRALSCLPDKVASEALKSLAEVVKATVKKQGEEMQQRKKVEKMEKHWEKKARGVESMLGEEEEQREGRGRGGSRGWMADKDADDDGAAASHILSGFQVGLMERRAAIAALRKKVEGEMVKHSKVVQDTRVFTMNNLQTGLPGVFEAMTGFSTLSSQVFQQLWSITRFHPSPADGV